MTRETKVGLLMVVMLVGVFGFMVYKKVHRPAEAMANQNRETTSPESNDEVLPFAGRGDNTDSLTQPNSRIVNVAATAPATIPENPAAVRVNSRLESPREPDPFEFQPTPAAKVKPKLPTSIPSDNDFFDAQSPTTAAAQQSQPAPSSSPAAAFDPFLEEAKPSTQTTVSSEKGNQPVEPTTTSNDPFEAPLEVAQPASSAAAAPKTRIQTRNRVNGLCPRENGSSASARHSSHR